MRKCWLPYSTAANSIVVIGYALSYFLRELPL
jgi:hypothetical protein